LGVGEGVGRGLGEGEGPAVNCTVSTFAEQEKPTVLSQSTKRQQGGPLLQGTELLLKGATEPPEVPTAKAS
jgi:hypothetical protein